MLRNILVCLALLSAGCATNASNAIMFDAQGGEPVFWLRNGGLQAACEILGGRVLYEGDIMVGIVNLRSHIDETGHYNMRWRWYDSDGLVMSRGEGQNSWRTQWVDPLDDAQVQGRAPMPGAVKAEFMIRWVTAGTAGGN